MQPSSDFHIQFAQALENPDSDCRALISHTGSKDQRRRFDIYRNNRAASLIDSLRSTYPAILSLVGEQFFSAAARGFIDRHAPTGPVMAEYGAGFGEYLSTLPNTGSVPYLQDIATLEWSWLQAYHSADGSVLTLEALAQAGLENISDLQLTQHPALFTLQSQWPVGSMWSVCTNQAEGLTAADINLTNAEAVVITRPSLEVLTNVVPASGHCFLLALMEGKSIGEAAELALGVDANFNTGDHLAGLVSLGAFSNIQPS